MTTYEKRLAAAKDDIRAVLKTYDHEIAQQRVRMNTSSNGFVRSCCRQEIERLTRDRNRLEKEILG